MKPYKLAKQTGIFESAVKLGPWKSSFVYVAKAKNPICVGLPQYIIEDEYDEARWATPVEIMELMNIFCV